MNEKIYFLFSTNDEIRNSVKATSVNKARKYFKNYYMGDYVIRCGYKEWTVKL